MLTFCGIIIINEYYLFSTSLSSVRHFEYIIHYFHSVQQSSKIPIIAYNLRMKKLNLWRLCDLLKGKQLIKQLRLDLNAGF